VIGENADDVVGVLADHRDTGVTAAHRQRGRLAGRLVTFDPHHLGARNHHLTGRSIAEFKNRLDHSAFFVCHHAALLG